MSVSNTILPQRIYLTDYSGNYAKYIAAIYEVFRRDFIDHRPSFGGYKLGLKYNPSFQDRAYTFYHMTHKGEIENERIPDLRRCECMPWARPTIEKASDYSLKFWEQRRKGKRRICIWLEVEGDVDYFLVLDIRKTYILPWTAFVLEHPHEKRKKQKEYDEWLDLQKEKKYSPRELVNTIMRELS
jgi:hypothetical protein